MHTPSEPQQKGEGWNGWLIAWTLFVFAALFWLWPNLIHEPMHLTALKLQGSDGYIDFDWSFPAHPSTTRTTSVNGIIGGFLFLLAPSLLSLLILGVLWATRKGANYWTHFVLAAYLTFDLIINVVGYRSPSSDFRFLQAFGLSHAIAVIGSTILIWAFMALLWQSGAVAHLVRPKAATGEGGGEGKW